MNDQTFLIDGFWTKDSLNDKIKFTENIKKELSAKKIILDFSSLKEIDSAGVTLLIKMIKYLKHEKNKEISIVNINEKHRKMLDFYRLNYTHQDIISKKHSDNIAHKTLKELMDLFHNLLHFFTFIGRVNFYLLYSIMHPSKIRFKATIKHIEIAGIHVLPIIAMSTFLVGFVTAYQGVEQLNKFGADTMVIEMSTTMIFRELAPFLAAVIVAGRSASSYTAQIGTMKLTEEIDAMKTMGFSPDIFLILPRIAALIIVMPLIVFFADMVALSGEMVLIKYHMGIPYSIFLDRIYEYVELKHFMLGILKAPLFGLIIATIGCYRGLQVRGSTTSIGNYTTKSVVNAIFWLIIVNSFISLLSIELGF